MELVKLLTVVVPVYKVERYINKCLDSLILPDDQIRKIEVIVVNDGTPDNSAILAREYEKRFPETFRVVDKENGGHGSAWNKGVELATGKYLRFLDSDDWLTNFELFVSKLETIDVDLVFTNMVKFYQVTNSEKRYDVLGMKEGVVYDANLFDWSLTNAMLEPDAVTNFQQCTYRTGILKANHPVFLEKQYYDDEILYVLPLIASKSFTFLNMTLYNYYIGREGQTVDPKVYVKGYDFKKKVRQAIQNFVEEHQTMSQAKMRQIDFVLNTRNNVIMKLISLMPISEGRKKAKDFIEWLNLNHPNYHRSKRIRLCNFSFIIFKFVSQLYKTFFK